MNNKLTMKALFVTGLLFACLQSPCAPTRHLVKKGETLSSICREYDVKLSALLKANPAVGKTKVIKVGQKLVIPGSAGAISATAAIATKAKPVKPKAVPSTPGVPYTDEDERADKGRPAPAALAMASTETTSAENHEEAAPVFSVKAGSIAPSDYAGLFGQYASHGYAVTNNRGTAIYLGENTTGNPYLALYDYAQVGSVVKVVNMMNQKSVFVKVVGHLAQADASREIILKLSRQAADEIGVTEDKFVAEIEGVK